MVCLASHRDDGTGGGELVSDGCGLVEEAAPAGVTLTVHFGGIGLSTG